MMGRLSKFVLPTAAFCFLLTMALILWGISRGFDIDDEGYFLMALRHPEMYPTLDASFHVLVSRLLGSELGVLGYRWVALILRLLASFVLAMGLLQWIKLEIDSEALMFSDAPPPPPPPAAPADMRKH